MILLDLQNFRNLVECKE